MRTTTRNVPASSPWLWALIAVMGVAFLTLASTARAAAPTITTVTPNTGGAGGGTIVTITGTAFDDDGTPTVTFGGNAGTVTASSDTSITVTTPPGTVGAVDVVVTSEGSDTEADGFTYHPTVDSLSVPGGSAGGGTSVTITGTGFEAGSTVFFGPNSATSVTFNSATSLTAVSPPGTAGTTVQVRVVTDGVSSPDVATDNFTYGSLPTVTSVAPTSGPSGTSVVITGTGFTNVQSVTFGGTPSTSVTVNSPTQITATAPTRTPGAAQVVVTTDNGASISAVNFTYVATVLPTVTDVVPDVGPTVGGTNITITGTGFTDVSAVEFGTVDATSFTVVSATSITAVAPALAAGTYNVRVTTPAGQSATAAANEYTASATIPVITSITPAGGPTGGGTSVTITGTGFTGATALTFGGTAATSFTVNSNTSITATAPAHAAGTVFVIVTSPSGTSAPTTGSRFVYGAVPTVTGLNPDGGPTAGGTSVVITGTGFTGATAVTFGGTAATSFTVNSDTQITAVSPARTDSVVFVRVTTPGGQSAEVAAAEFTYGTGEGETITYTLRFRWTLIAWLGEDGITVTAALAGGDNDDTTDITGQVSAIYRWNATTQRWEGNFPTAGNVPGANDFTTLAYGNSYFIAITTSGSVTWVVDAGP